MYRSLTFLGKVTPGYFMVFHAIVMAIAFFISLSDLVVISSILYRNGTDLHVDCVSRQFT